MTDIDSNDLKLLTLVRIAPGTTIARLTRMLSSTTTIVQRQVVGLEGRGLLELRGHPDRPSVKEIHVTPLGRSVIDPV